MKRSRVVTAAAKAIQMSGSGSKVSGPPGNRPVGEYGYVDSYRVGHTTCSMTRSDSKPAASAAAANRRALAASEKFVLAKCRANFMAISLDGPSARGAAYHAGLGNPDR